jgi:NADH:ubiquinone oxidoreductase subunit D
MLGARIMHAHFRNGGTAQDVPEKLDGLILILTIFTGPALPGFIAPWKCSS